MKLKFWTFEYEFDKNDAKIVIPILLLIVSLTVTTLSPTILVGLAILYYLIYFFFDTFAKYVISCIPKPKLRCPYCRNQKLVLQGYQGYRSDEHYPYYLCTSCDTTSILTDGGLLDISHKNVA
jgi:hypothetical protein